MRSYPLDLYETPIRHDDGPLHPFGTSRNNVGVPSEGAEPLVTAEEVGASTVNSAAASRRHASVLAEPTKAFHSHTLRSRENNAKHGQQPSGITTGHISDGNTMLPVLAVHQNRSLPSPDARGFWHCTYVTYDPDTGEWYGGKHSTKDLEDGYLGSGTWIVTHPQPERLICEIVDFHVSEEDAFAAEAILITDQTIMDDALCMNERGGGVGFTIEAVRRYRNDPAAKQKASERFKTWWADPVKRKDLLKGNEQLWADPLMRQKLGQASAARWADPMTRAKMALANKNRWAKPEATQKMSEIRKLKLADPLERQKLSDAMKRHYADPATYQKKADLNRAMLADPVVRQKLSDANKRRWSDPDARQKQSETLKLIRNDPLVKEQVSEWSKQMWAKRKATIGELLHIAVTETDFTGDLTNDQRLLEINVENSIDLAALIWEERHDYAPVPLSLIREARAALLLEADLMLADRAAHAEAERLDAITAGDIDADGEWIPYDTYRGV